MERVIEIDRTQQRLYNNISEERIVGRRVRAGHSRQSSFKRPLHNNSLRVQLTTETKSDRMRLSQRNIAFENR